MARGTQLTLLVDRLRAEVGHSTNVSVGVDNLPMLKQIIRRTQETLYDEYDWPHLRILPTKAMAAGQRYYDFPTNLNYERVEEVVIWYSGNPHPLRRGVGFAEYAQYDSDSDERSEPGLAWDIRHTGTNEQFEIWPIPTTNTQTVQFKGIKNLDALTDDADLAELDDQLIILFAAAEILARQKSQDADIKLAAARSRFNRLKARTRGDSPVVALGQGDGDRRPLRGQTVIRIS